MPSHRRLSSVCQSIAHHAASSLSYVHPHLLQALKATGEPIAMVDLLSATPYPKELRSHPHLPTALSSLRDRFEQILKSEGFLISDLNEAKLFFKPDGQYSGEYCCECHAKLLHSSGRKYFAAVNCMGKSIVPQLANI
ncbi:hypothetical protein [Pseudomonas kilonensis]|uniref:hypothetical protein n=1 Tax=Pseudomonas kilonensis TaxID=132476 RepID=UPI0013CF02A3|nr:hypothetical protein [Pseudomonas kilonensis]MCP1453440.1 hypothetical protein [Pseudomonas kilonensis]